MQFKLRTLDALCVAGAVEDCLDRLRVLQTMTPNVITQRDEMSNLLGDAVARIIKEQKRCEARYEKLVKRRSELKSLANKTRYKKNQQKIEEQARELQKLTRELCKRLRESPNVSDNLMKIQTQRTNLISLFESFHTELLKGHSFTGIAKWTADLYASYRHTVETIQSDNEMKRQIASLNARIQQTEKEMTEKMEELDLSIREHKDQLAAVLSMNETEAARRNDELQAREGAVRRMNELTQAKLARQSRELRMIQETEGHVHDISLKYFERRRQTIGTMTQEWEERYQRETTDKKAELKRLTDRIEKATRDTIELEPKKEESEQLLKLEQVRDKQRAMQNENLSQMERFMGKLKVVYALHARKRGPLPRPKKRRRRG